MEKNSRKNPENANSFEEKQANFSFEIVAKSADFPLMRAGIIRTPHGNVETPCFLNVQTEGHTRYVANEFMAENDMNGARLMNGYHLWPGAARINAAGGVGKYFGPEKFGWPTFTDSAGFQVQSLGNSFGKIISTGQNEEIRNQENPKNSGENDETFANDFGVIVNENGATFRDPHSGRIVEFTPEFAIQNEHRLGADVMMNFDYLGDPFYDPKNFAKNPELQNFKNNYEYQKYVVDLTARWAERCLREHIRQTNLRATKPYQALYFSVQGANIRELRERAAIQGAKMSVDGAKFDGAAIGGMIDKYHFGVARTVYESKKHLPENWPIHLLGMSRFDDIIQAVEQGVDTFDCVEPTRAARNGWLFTRAGDIKKIGLGIFADDEKPIDPECKCVICSRSFRENYDEIPDEIRGEYNQTFMKITHEKLHEKEKDFREKIERISRKITLLEPEIREKRNSRNELKIREKYFSELRENLSDKNEKNNENMLVKFDDALEILREKIAKLDAEIREIDGLRREKTLAENEISYLKIIENLDPGKPISRKILRAMSKSSDVEIRALFRAFATPHNIFWTQNLVREIRAAIINGNYPAWKKDFLRARNLEPKMSFAPMIATAGMKKIAGNK